MNSVNRFAPGLFTVFVACLLLASGCATSSPAMRHYLLTPVTEGAMPDTRLDERSILVGPLQLPGYLDRPQLVTRMPDGRLALHEYERWAEPLDTLLVRTLAESLARLTGSQRIVTFPQASRTAADLRISGRIIRFDVDASGLAVLQVQWTIQDSGGEFRQPVRSTEFRAQASGDDAPARVAALSDTLGQFAASLAAELGAAALR